MIKILSGDPYRVREACRYFKEAFLKDHDALNFERIDVQEGKIACSEVIGRLHSTSLFATKQLVILENLNHNQEFLDNVETLCGELAPGVSLVMTVDIDKKTRWGKFLSEQPDYRDYPPYQASELRNKLLQRAGELETFLTPKTADYLIVRLGSDLFILDNELQKLSVYPKITTELIDQLTVANYNSQIFELLDNLFRGHPARSLQLYDEQRQQKQEPLAILGTLTWQLQIFVIAKLGAAVKSDRQIAQDFKLHVFPVQKALSAVSNMDWNYLHTFIDLCRQIDRDIRLHFVSADDALKYLILKGSHL